MRIHHPIVLLAALLTCMACDGIPPQPTVRLQSYSTYFTFLPTAYESQEKWPLILFLHGAGQAVRVESGALSYNAVPKYAVEHEDFPFIVVAPQSLNPDTWIAERLNDLLDEIIARYRVDEDRIYVTGLSMGGFGTFLLGAAYPDRIAAAIPIAGGGRPEEACQMREVPTWVFHNVGDPIVSVELSEAMVDALERCDGDVQFTRYERNHHDAWSDTYFDPGLYDWLLSHRRSDRD